MLAHVYVYVYVYTSVYVFAFAYVYSCLCVHVYVYVHMHVYMYVHAQPFGLKPCWLKCLAHNCGASAVVGHRLASGLKPRHRAGGRNPTQMR